jgi:cation diffusion facilitator CzcD-associated flavoprotein CzcO
MVDGPQVDAGRPLRFIVIGAGVSGILAAIRLRQEGFSDVTVYEKAQRLGGAWRDDAYPEVACDIRFGEEVTGCEFLHGRWYVETRSGHWDSADVIVAATGAMHP